MDSKSLSARRAWIEIYNHTYKARLAFVALRKESVDRNASCEINICIAGKSLSARRAWIEMAVACCAPLWMPVALRKESVDRNEYLQFDAPVRKVALRKESVDRNGYSWQSTSKGLSSLSARRAWIEITITTMLLHGVTSRSPQGERG